jgi:cyanophycin synthetase
VALQLQQEAGFDIRRGKTRQIDGQPGRYDVIFGFGDEREAIQCAAEELTAWRETPGALGWLADQGR